MYPYIKKLASLAKKYSRVLYRGFKQGLLSEYLYATSKILREHFSRAVAQLGTALQTEEKKFAPYQKRIKGLHSLLPAASQFRYSILIPLKDSSFTHLKSCLDAVCAQTPPHFEVLIGTKQQLPHDAERVIAETTQSHPHIVKFFDLRDNWTETPVLNLLAEQAEGDYFLVVNPTDWIRPDLLYMYELVLRAASHPQRSVVYSSTNVITENGFTIPYSDSQRLPPSFPYVFKAPFDLRGLLIPKALWRETGGLDPTMHGARDTDLILRFDAAGATFHHIPISFYSRRKGTEKWAGRNAADHPYLIRSLTAYTKAKGLDWHFEQGLTSHTVRAIPQNIPPHYIQVVIPYKDQKDLTLKCIASLKRQKGVRYHITAVDNNSEDRTIAEALRQEGAEVLRIDEPFNYSRLNNLAVERSNAASECDLVLLLNNDVELDEHAIAEMVRWIDQPHIGIVGARLHYPNGTLQHGGVRLLNRTPNHHAWEHIEKERTFDKMEKTKAIAIVDAVTAACVLLKKSTYQAIGGFDEVHYPIACSDTNLAVKLKRKGLLALYTPYAKGIHYESVSRKQVLEDIETSLWLHELAAKQTANIP